MSSGFGVSASPSPRTRLLFDRNRVAAILSLCFITVAFPLTVARPLWLDEILQVIDARGATTSDVLHALLRNCGGAPLYYLLQHFMLAWFDFSPLLVRLPNVLCGGASVVMVALVAEELGLFNPWIAALLFALMPQTLRYGVEARAYGPALLLSLLTVYFFLRWSKQRRPHLLCLYSLCLLLCAYTQPYAASVAFALMLWAAWERDWRLLWPGLMASSMALVLFLPWVLWARAGWTSSIQASAFHFVLSAKTPLMLWRELSGAGYWGAVPLTGIVILGFRRGALPVRTKRLLLLLMVVPILAALTLDAAFDYFIAVRQFLWVLPPLAILAAAGVELRSRWSSALGLLLVGACVVLNVRAITAEREDWQAAANTAAALAGPSGCLSVTPPSHISLYNFYQPSLHNEGCNGDERVLAVDHYTTPRERAESEQSLLRLGFRPHCELHAGGSTLILMRR